MKGWLSRLLDRLTGKILEEERLKSAHTINEARFTVRESKAMLDGEDFWLLPAGQRKTPCNGHE